MQKNKALYLSVIAPTLSGALEELKRQVAAAEQAGRRTVIFCEDRLSLVAERAVCAAVGGTFSTSVYTLARFLSCHRGGEGILSGQGSAIVIRDIIEHSREELRLFSKLSAASAARSVYDTIALLYSSGIGADDIEYAQAHALLGDKLHDIALIYRRYNEYLAEIGRLDRNVYLRLLPPVIEQSPAIIGADVIFLGFQAFTGTVLQCVKACMLTADNCCGLFVGGASDIYANEAPAQFEVLASECRAHRAAMLRTVTLPSDLIAEAEIIRNGLFEPASYFNGGMSTDKVLVFEAEDEDRELEFIAASIKKFVHDGVRYGKIAVMLPGTQTYAPVLARVFAQYRIPYYLDERRTLAEHPLSAFICDFLECIAGGCAAEDVLAASSSYLFNVLPAAEGEGEEPKERARINGKYRDIFRNYVLRCANWRGGIRREPNADICGTLGFDYAAVSAAWKSFSGALALFPVGRAAATEWAAAVRSLVRHFDCEVEIANISAIYGVEYPARAQFNTRGYAGILSVADEIEELAPTAAYTAREFKKLFSSGLAAAEIALIPPKTDAVFVGDISATVNTGSDVVFAAGLTDAVPPAGSDTALLTDRELTSLEHLNIKISPKISQVDRRRRETVALNLCSFRQRLYITYPAMSGGEEKIRSEIVAYILKLFKKLRDGAMILLRQKALDASGRAKPYYCSELVPALKVLAGGTLRPRKNSALYGVLSERGYAEAATSTLRAEAQKGAIQGGMQLFAPSGSVSPTLLETYFTCPYKNFAQRGLRLVEREEGAVRPIDTGNFIHSVLQKLAGEFSSIESCAQAEKRGEDIARLMLEEPQYSSIARSASGKLVAERLVKEAGMAGGAAYSQLADSSFTVRDAEKWYNSDIGGVHAGGRIDRVDSFGDMVRVIDYKTGETDISPQSYYAGVKLQLPFYLLAASQGARPVGAYYFPANIDFSENPSNFKLEGFSDASEDSVRASDKELGEKGSSRFTGVPVGGGRKGRGAIEGEDFADFLAYSTLIARRGTEGIFGGNITPSPYGGACRYCKLRGMCGLSPEAEPREVNSLSCADIAHIVRKTRGEE